MGACTEPDFAAAHLTAALFVPLGDVQRSLKRSFCQTYPKIGLFFPYNLNAHPQISLPRQTLSRVVIRVIPPPPGPPPDLLLQGRLEELQQQIPLPRVGGVAVQREDDGLQEGGGFVLGHLEQQPGQVGGLRLRGGEQNRELCSAPAPQSRGEWGRMGGNGDPPHLQQVEEVLVRLQLLPLLLAERFEPLLLVQAHQLRQLLPVLPGQLPALGHHLLRGGVRGTNTSLWLGETRGDTPTHPPITSIPSIAVVGKDHRDGPAHPRAPNQRPLGGVFSTARRCSDWGGGRGGC